MTVSLLVGNIFDETSHSLSFGVPQEKVHSKSPLGIHETSGNNTKC